MKKILIILFLFIIFLGCKIRFEENSSIAATTDSFEPGCYTTTTVRSFKWERDHGADGIEDFAKCFDVNSQKYNTEYKHKSAGLWVPEKGPSILIFQGQVSGIQ